MVKSMVWGLVLAVAAVAVHEHAAQRTSPPVVDPVDPRTVPQDPPRCPCPWPRIRSAVSVLAGPDGGGRRGERTQPTPADRTCRL